MVGEDLSRNRTDAPAIAGRRAFTGLQNDEGMLLICPTSQIVFRMHSCRPATLHGVVLMNQHFRRWSPV
jgi:hypothetical protein